MPDIKIRDERKLTVREVPVDSHFVIHRYLKEVAQAPLSYVLRRTDDPYHSITLMGTYQYTFPSDKCFLAEIIEDE